MSTTDRWRAVLDDLRANITEGRWAPGTRLPTLDQLMKQYDVGSRPAMQKVITELAAEGLVVTERRRGTYVRRYSPLDWRPGTFERAGSRRDTAGAGMDAWQADVAAQERAPGQEVQVETIVAPAGIAERLELEAGSEAVVRRRLRLVDGTPWQTADSYYPLWVAQGTPIMEPGDIIIPGGLMAATGHAQKRFRDEIVVRMPTPDERERLELPPGTPVAEHVRTGFDAAERPVRVIITIAPGDRHRIIYEVTDQWPTT